MPLIIVRGTEHDEEVFIVDLGSGAIASEFEESPCPTPPIQMKIRRPRPLPPRPTLHLLAPCTPPPSRCESPAALTSCAAISPTSPGAYASYPHTPVEDSSFSSSSSASEGEGELEDTDGADDESEDATDYSLPALLRARALQTRRHVPHPFSSVLGARAALYRIAGVAGWVLVAGVLASRGRWGA
ncbi:hypothetical protein K438DRAFT_1754111 [Mycena galopus ATCC 62051]|nr:hypothetical protein K438DRAFT_1754111 [Mycena galopus ATCC 62051]